MDDPISKTLKYFEAYFAHTGVIESLPPDWQAHSERLPELCFVWVGLIL